jgi:hypothetical protein
VAPDAGDTDATGIREGETTIAGDTGVGETTDAAAAPGDTNEGDEPMRAGDAVGTGVVGDGSSGIKSVAEDAAIGATTTTFEEKTIGDPSDSGDTGGSGLFGDELMKQYCVLDKKNRVSSVTVSG